MGRLRYVVTAVQARAPNVEYMKLHIPTLEAVFDTGNTSEALRTSRQHTFFEALDLVGNDALVLLEDDVVLTRQFCKKAEIAIEERPEAVIQFFSRRADDIRVGSRWQSGSAYLMNQCTYWPAGLAANVKEWMPSWYARQTALGNVTFGAADLMMAGYFAEHKIRHWVSIPSLVEHSIGVSAINPSRAKKRQSKTFTAPELSGMPPSLVLKI